MKKSKLITTMAAIAATTSIAPITMISCGNITTYEVTIEEGEINDSHNVTISKTKATANKQFDAVIDWENKENGRIEDYSVNIGGEVADRSAITLDPITGAISIPKELIVGKINITVKIVSTEFMIAKKEGCTVDFDTDWTKKPHYMQDYTNTVTLADESLISLLTNFEIYVGSSHIPLIKGDDYTINPLNGEFTIYGKHITDNIYINIEGAREVKMTMKASQNVQYVSVIDNLRVAEYRIDCDATPLMRANHDLKIEAEIIEVVDPEWASYPGKSIRVAYTKYDDANDQVVVGIASSFQQMDKDLFEKKFRMHVWFKNTVTGQALANANYETPANEHLLFENVIPSTPDMLLYSDSKKTVTGPDNNNPKWETCEALVIPKDVVKIGPAAFGGFGSYKESSNVKWLILDATWGGRTEEDGSQCQLKQIASTAFQAINCLKSGFLYIPASVEQLDSCAFAMIKTSNPSTFTVKFARNSNLQLISDSCFNGSISCSGELEIPANVKIIERNTFNGTGFQTIDFTNAKSLEEIGAASSVTDRGTSFKNMRNLSGGIILPDGLKIIHKQSFACKSSDESNNVTQLKIPSTVSQVGDEAFANLTKLNMIDMSQWDSTEAIQTWGNNIFINCAKTGVVKVKNADIGDDILIILQSRGLPEGWTFEIA